MSTTTLQKSTYLRGSAALAVTETDIFTMPALGVAKIETIVLYNNTAGALTATIHVRPGGVAAASANEVCQESIASHARLVLTLPIILAQGDVVSGLGSGTGVNAWVSASESEQGRGFA